MGLCHTEPLCSEGFIFGSAAIVGFFQIFFFFESYKKPAPCAAPGRISGTEYILKLATETHTGRAFVVMLLMAAAVLTSTV